MQSVLLSLHIIEVFQMMGFLRHTFFFNEQDTKYVSIYQNDDLKPQERTGTPSGYVVSDIQWFILVTFKRHIPKNEVQKLGDSHHILNVLQMVYLHYD